MDKNENTAPWTNEKHLHYLNSMEDSFVRRVFENNNNNNPHRLLRLDRYIPDTSDSTLDSTSRRSKNHADAAAAAVGTSGGRKSFENGRSGVEMDGRDDSHKRRRRRHSFQPYTSSSSSSAAAAAASVQQDQVVPQIGNRRGDDNL